MSASTVKDFQLTSHPHRLLLFNAFESKVIKTHQRGWHALKCLIFFTVLMSINLKRLWFLSITINSGGAYGQLSLIATRLQCNRLCLPLLRKGWRLEALQGKDHFFFVRLSHTVSATQIQAIHTAAFLAKEFISMLTSQEKNLQGFRTGTYYSIPGNLNRNNLRSLVDCITFKEILGP